MCMSPHDRRLPQDRPVRDPAWTMQDVYKTEYCGRALYVKLTKGAGGKTVVISFHDDESEHS